MKKDLDGYTIYKSKGISSWPYLRHSYLVDGKNIEGDKSKGLWTLDELDHCKTKKDVLKIVRRFKGRYDKIEVWEEYCEEDIDKYGWPVLGDIVSQTLFTYVNGMLVSKEEML